MKHSFYKNLVLLFLSLSAFYSCSTGTVNPGVVISDDATIKALYINQNAKSPNANLAVFIIDNVKEEITNIDSLPYLTRIDSLVPNIRFTAGSNGFIINDTLTYNLSSTIKAIDFTKKVKITNVATDGKTQKTYTVKLNVHKIDPYLHLWTRLADEISQSNVYENQKAVLKKDSLFFYTNSGTNNYLYTSTNGVRWDSQPVSGLPANALFQNRIGVLGNKVYLLHGAQIYASVNGIQWQLLSTDTKYTFQSLIGNLQSKLWAVAKNNVTNSYCIVNSADGADWQETLTPLPDQFPLSGFAATTFTPRYGAERMLVVGGTDVNGVPLNTRWITENGSSWANLENDKSTFSPIADAAIAYYGSRLILLDNYYADKNKFKYVRNSLDKGMTWAMADTTQNRPAESYPLRAKASVVVNPNNNTMYIIGGVTQSATLSDVWKVKVNYYGFEDWTKY